MITDKMISRMRDSDLLDLCRELRRSTMSGRKDPWDCQVRAADDYAKVLEAVSERCPEAMDDVQRVQAELARRMKGIVSVSLGLSAMAGPTVVSIDFEKGTCSATVCHGESYDGSFDPPEGKEMKRRVLKSHPEILHDRTELSDRTFDLIPYGGCTFVFDDGTTYDIPSNMLNGWFVGELIETVSSFCVHDEVPLPDLRHGILAPEYVLLMDGERFEKLYERTEDALSDAVFDEDEKGIEENAYRLCVLRKEALYRDVILDDKEKAGISLRGEYDGLSSISYATDGLSVHADLSGKMLTVNGEQRSMTREDVRCIREQLTHCYLNLHTSETTEDEGTITMTYWDGKQQVIDQRDLMDPLGAVYPMFCGLRDL